MSNKRVTEVKEEEVNYQNPLQKKDCLFRQSLFYYTGVNNSKWKVLKQPIF